jgi:(1->4)-alpha-D-glucan 1-alpha-D-glucosylmutase
VSSTPRGPVFERPIVATYRIQLTPEFAFDQLRSRLPYVARLGVSHLYLSPCLEAVSGSAHGYDVTDPARVRSDFGGEPALVELFAACEELGLGVVMDIVPNHMAASATQNPWWRDLLRWGADSSHARYFDVDWARHDGRILLPILGKPRRAALSQGGLRLEFGESGLELVVDDERLPIAARSLGAVFGVYVGGEPASRSCLERLEACLSNGAPRAEIERAERALFDRLATPELAATARAWVAAINAAPEHLQAILEAQYYRLRFWRAGLEELNYRRFFDISALAALRVEDREVFDAIHVQIRRWLASPPLAGVRVDHPDGLKDPEQYLERLRELIGPRCLYVEKILKPGETLARWPVDGTTGYDFASISTRLFVDSGAEAVLTATYCRLAELPGYDFQRSLCAAKGRALRELFGAEVAALTARALPVCEAARGASGAGDVQQALLGLLTGLPVYRTYLRPGRPATEADRAALEAAARYAVADSPELGPLVDRLVDLLVGTRVTPRHDDLASAFQQLSGPAMAKGLEDTVFYDDARLLALNEVGNDPARFGASVEEFHEHARHTQLHWPRTLSATSTHDTKRSADVRLRIALLSEVPGEWAVRSEAWMRRARALPGGASVDPRTLYFLLQTLVGAHPISLERLQGYLLKAVREAKAWTSWLSPDLPREARFAELVAALSTDEVFKSELSAFVARLEPAFVRHALALTLLQLTAPGVPDIYQGSELWDYSLADPDNRRRVDFDLRERLLDELESARPSFATSGGPAVHETGADGPLAQRLGAEKLWLTRRALELRRARPECFDARGAYTSLAVVGDERHRVVAYQRGTGVVVVAPRLTLSLTRGWRGTRVVLPAARFVNVLTGEPLVSGRLEDLVARFPVALLVEG